MTRPIIIRTRVTESERALIKRLANRDGVGASEFMRRLVREAEIQMAISDAGMAILPAPIVAEAEEFPVLADSEDRDGKQ